MKTIALTRNKMAIVDDSDYPVLSKYKWHANWDGYNWYATRMIFVKGKRKVIWMHREILKSPSRFQTDHINHNGLDNRRCNLRRCTASQNAANRLLQINKTSKCKGVSREKKRGKWRSLIKYNYKTIFLGRFESETDAAIAYDKAAKKLFGEFACTNF